MNLSWIVALLRPRDLLVGRSKQDKDPACQLAALVLGDPLYLHKFETDPVNVDIGLRFVAQSLDSSSIREGLTGLVREVVETHGEDSARACALGLMACCAAAEIEDYAACEMVIESLLDRLNSGGDPNIQLLRALVLQQKSLRLWDTNRNPEPVSTEALLLISGITADDLQPCTLGPYADFTATAESLISTLQHAIWSLAPTFGIEMGQVDGWSNFPSREQMIKSPRSEQLTRVKSDRAEIYAKFVQQTFRNRFGSRARYILGGPEVPDMFAQSLAMELMGHAGVRESRKELALLRLVQIDAYEQSEHVRDALRLLRHSGAYKELSLAVERFRAAGPLWALSEDARQIIQRRTGLYALGRSELRVLRGAAELMTKAEANRALATAQAWSGDSHVGEAWLTAAALAVPAKKSDQVADFILQQVENHKHAADRLDKDLARAVRALDWSTVHPEVNRKWSYWLRENTDRWPATAESIFGFLGVEPDDSQPMQDLDSVAVRINRAINGNAMPIQVVQQSVEMVTRELQNLVAEARGESYSMRFLSAADIAAALIISSGADLWQDLVACLIDPEVSRQDTDAAFERLAHERPPIPDSAADSVRESARQLLEKRERFFDSQSQVTPYPEALRFLAVYGLIDDGVLFSSVAQLAGHSSSAVREQAARTVAAVAKVRKDAWISAVAIQLSHDHDVSVRSHAGRALALLADNQDLQVLVIRDRIVQLLEEDGVAIPIRLLSAMKAQAPSDSEVREKIKQLWVDHPSLSVRRIAGEVVSNFT